MGFKDIDQLIEIDGRSLELPIVFEEEKQRGFDPWDNGGQGVEQTAIVRDVQIELPFGGKAFQLAAVFDVRPISRGRSGHHSTESWGSGRCRPQTRRSRDA